DTTMSKAQALAEPSRDNCAPGTALIDTEAQVVCHNRRGIVSGVHMIFGTIDKVRQIISTLFGSRAVPVSGVSPHVAVTIRKALADDIKKKENQIREAHSQLDRLIQQNEFLTKELVKRDNDLRKTHMQLSTAKEKGTKLRAILLEKTNFDRVSDHEIKDKFLSIRQKAQAISRSSTYDLSMLDPAIWGHLTVQDRKNIIMSGIFDLLQCYILNSRVFCQYQLLYDQPDPNPRYDIEVALSDIETILEHNHVDETLIVNWRIATMDCLSELIGSSPRHKIVAHEIFADFALLISPKSGTREQNELREQFQTICDEAWEVAMIMRRSREGHKCFVPPTGTTKCLFNAYESLVEPITVEGGKNEDGSDEIAYSLFGALVKGAQCHWEATGEGVLEKAQVVLKRREHAFACVPSSDHEAA
ncbi:unnamed protein product, partial [Clonostachys rhizophaga]